MFQINARRKLASSELEACEDISQMMNASLKRMQAMLKDLSSLSVADLKSLRHDFEGLMAEADGAGNGSARDVAASMGARASRGLRRLAESVNGIRRR